MDLHVRLDGRGDLSGQLYRQVRAAVLAGRLPAGQPLPPTRELAGDLGIARNTVSMAYDRLAAEGFLVARPGVGTFVAAGLAPDRPPDDGGDGDPVALVPRAVWAGLPAAADLAATEAEFDFRPGVPDATLFPYAAWRRVTARQLRATAVGTGAHIAAAGHPALRAAIARHVAVARGVPAAPDDVVVTSGSQQAVDLLARVLLSPGDVVAVEDPGYPLPRKLLTSSGFDVVPVPVDDEGLVVGALPDPARLVYVTPSHQFPLGTSMSLGRRLALLEWARRTGALIVEDDYDSEFRFAGRPFEPLAGLGAAGHVAYVGSFSKTLLPTLRLGFVVAPRSLRDAIHQAKQLLDWHTAVPAQAALAELIDEGLFARHLKAMRRVYARRHHLVTSLLRRDFAGVLEPVPSLVGLHVTALFTDPRADDVEVAARARSAGVEVLALSPLAVAHPVRGLALGYGAITEDRIAAGLAVLRTAAR
ncbi:MocR-like pyridoxine biosynthesis transcription factor PdxR [Jiangella alkaliphila]|uniref:Transcriptional regulator, GntR family n=1 Tax=Jiangella alkaliphila TaxID=419479 RepID=A0A1H2I977_9ACTN|nr:PLP-dependent aminotransferase family protein [Jiangella alkaliphila]SDU40639.1 transcriptional regulator, GntR family [Jiangella alkaliphila]